ncbi:3-hydroxyacyl-CoA dehydrogenase family protein [Lacisediminihabitans profunda]|uniref:3-hydroxyacyl-CoA dehydrogenase family protein n=1 Tax=Lacisediminihabitans profunda TaxID=2594790 RepID=A0A5C8UQQ8_9MICO|nr:3-hydroxyacyl-CoA dehydrogenase family protein [Lacisediminihabitans profunda]TXN30931.1 3-hydroxyacyl-CoA dehydrogenase family protein [Lacisediminihabitans profunda]
MTVNSQCRVAAIGSGYMGGGIAQVLALAGSTVTLGDVDEQTASLAFERIVKEAEAFEIAHLLDQGSAMVLRSRLRIAPTLEDAVAEADYVTEAVPESREIKADALSRISAAAPASAVIGSNTSAIPIQELAQSVRHPERFLGVHWMNPAPFIPAVELIAAEATRADVVDTVEAFIRSAGKAPVRVADTPGFVANRLQFALFKEAVRIVEEGSATPSEVDEVVSNAFGFRLALFGPFAIADMAGLDVYNASYSSLEAEYGERLASPAMLSSMVAHGHLGIKSGGGFLDIDAKDVVALVDYRNRAYVALSALRKALGPAPGL